MLLFKPAFLRYKERNKWLREEKKLDNVKHNHTSVTLFSLAYTNNMGEISTCIDSRALSNVSKLIRVQETVCQHMK